MKLFSLKAGVALATVAASYAVTPHALAQSTATIPVTATVAATCRLSSPSTLDFGKAVDTVNNANLRNQGAVTVQCNRGQTGFIGLASLNSFALRAGTESMTYNVVKPTGATCPTEGGTIWRNTGADRVSVSFASSAEPVVVPVCGAIDPNQPAVQAGTYTDTLTATVSIN
jgi:spore coat protein U-like protein